jgi:hypothetical protein
MIHDDVPAGAQDLTGRGLVYVNASLNLLSYSVSW